MQATKRVKSPRKQRKRLYTAPAHLRHKLMAAPLSPQLTASKSVKTLPVRKGDTVRIMRGDHKGFEGKISRVDLKTYRIYLEGLTREKVDGTAIFLPVHPSKVMIKNLNLSDKWRKAIVERKEELAKKAAKVEKPQKKIKKAEKVAEKPPAKAAKVDKEVKKVVKEKPVKVKEKAAKAKVAIEKKAAKTKIKPKAATVPTKAQKKKKTAPKEKPTAKEKKPKAPKTAKKTRAKSKAALEEKKGGT